jgi:hypothetical protein
MTDNSCTLPHCPCAVPCAVYAKCHEAVERMLAADPFAIARAIARYAATIPIEACTP